METRICYICKVEKPLTDFNKNKNKNKGVNYECRECYGIYRRKFYKDNPEIELFRGAKVRAKRKKIDFDLTVEDIQIPTTCPILGINIKQSEKIFSEHSPSLDRIDPKQGYVKGNVRVISYRANMLKSNASIKELEALLEDARKYS